MRIVIKGDCFSKHKGDCPNGNIKGSKIIMVWCEK